MKTSRIYLDGLVVHARYRKADDEKVSALAASMGAIGLQQPISVWAEPDKSGVETVHLVAGLHRVRAAEKLGWEQIDAVIVDLNETNRRRWEIAENLHRAELTALEHDQHLAEWIRLTEQIEAEKNAPPVLELTRELDAEPARRGRPKKQKPVQSEPVSRKGGRGHHGGVRQAARELGVSQPDAQRALKVASLTPTVPGRPTGMRATHRRGRQSRRPQASTRAPID